MEAGWRMRFRPVALLSPFFILAAATAGALEPGEHVSKADKVAWFASHAAVLRSINPRDRDYSDLQPLQQAIGNAHVVLLGGTNEEGIMKARYRLVRFLHEEMGFDVLTSDMSLFDAEEFDRSLDRGKSPRPDLEEQNQSLFWYVSPRYERIDLLSYIRDTHKTDRPLHLSGFGWSVSPYMVLEYSKRLSEFLDRVAPQSASPAERKAIQAVVELSGPRHSVYLGGPIQRFLPVQPKQWEKALRPGLNAIAQVYAALGRLPTSSSDVGEIIYYRETLANLAFFAAGQARHPLREVPPDAAVAMSKVWRANSKIIVWSSNWRVGRNWPPGHRFSYGELLAPARSTGIEFARAYGRDAYAIAFREIKNDNGVLQVLEAGPEPKLAPVDGDLESLLHAAGKPYSFVDFRTVPADHWLRSPLSARMVNGSQVDVWPDHFDGLVTIDIPISKERK